MGVTEPEALEEPLAAPVGETFVAGQQDLADLVERVVLAAPMPELFLLDPTADRVETPLSDPNNVKRICDLSGRGPTGRSSPFGRRRSDR